MKDCTIIGYDRCLCEGCKVYRKEKGIPEPVSAYDAEVRRIAEVLAAIEHARSFNHLINEGLTKFQWEEMSEQHKAANIDAQIPAARAMVAEMANCFVAGVAYASPCAIPVAIDNEMTSRGLISASEKKL